MRTVLRVWSCTFSSLAVLATFGQWAIMSQPTTQALYDLHEYDGQLFIASRFGVGTQVYASAAYDGSSFSFPNELQSNNYGTCFVEHNNALLLGGAVSDQQTINGVAQWNGSTWIATPYNVGNALPVAKLFSHGDTLYASGSFATPYPGLAMHDGTQWNPMGAGLNGLAMDFAFFDGSLYACGWMYSSGSTPLNCITRWTGSNWEDVGGGLGGGSNNIAYDMEVYNGELYVVGNFSTAGGLLVDGIAKWNGANWSTLGSGSTTPQSEEIRALAVTSQGLYVGGYFASQDGQPFQNIAVWDGTAWSDPGGLPNPSHSVYSIAEYQGHIYLGTYNTSGTMDYGLLWRDSEVGIAEVPPQHVLVGPNPVQNTLTVTSMDAPVRALALYDAQGRLLRTTTLTTLPMNDLAPGTYVLRTQLEEGVAVHCVVKEE